MKRREFIAMLGSAAVGMPLNAHAQQKQAMPVIGFLRNSSPEVSPHLLTAFRLGLSEAGYSEGQNVAIDYHWAQGNYALLPNMAAELVRRGTTVIFAGGTGEALAAKAACLDVFFGIVPCTTGI